MRDPPLHGRPRALQLLPLLLLLLSVRAASQNDPAAADGPPTPPAPLQDGHRFNSSMAVIMVVLVSAFFVMGFFSVYIRQCADRRYGRGDPAGPYAFGRRSLRGAARGLDPSVIDAFPTFLYSSVKGLKIGKGALECAVCLNEFQDDETLRLIPKCSHAFHPDCIDSWLSSHTTCPVCRADLALKPGEALPSAVQLLDQDQAPDAGGSQGHFSVHVSPHHDEPRPPSEGVKPSPRRDADSTADEGGPRRSSSTGMRLARMFLFPRSHSTGHSLWLVRPGDDCERFTLRLPEDVRTRIINEARLERARSCVAFPRASSPRTAYRSGSSRRGGRDPPLINERFDREGRYAKWAFSMTPPFISKTGSARAGARQAAATATVEVGTSPLRSSSKPDKSPPFDRWFVGRDVEAGERSTDWLRQPSSQT